MRGAVVRTMTTAGRTVLFSGLIVAASLASQAAVALANSNLFRELTRRQGRLEALVDVSQRVTRERPALYAARMWARWS